MTATRGKKVIGVGLGCLDQLLIWRDAAAPVAGNKVVDFDFQGGGMAATAMVAVARLGGSAEFWGVVGDDAAGRMIVAGLQAEGVDISQVRAAAGASGPVVVVCIDQQTGERYFVGSREVPDPPQPLGDLSRIESAGCLLVDGFRYQSVLRAAQHAHKRGVPVVGDIGWITDKTRVLFQSMDYAIASAGTTKNLGLGEDHAAACRAIAQMGPKYAVITAGARGLFAWDGQRLIEKPAFSVPVVDTTGAGDTFHGAFCYGVISGMQFEENLTFSSAVAAMKCRKLGGRAGIPGLNQVQEFLRERGVKRET